MDDFESHLRLALPAIPLPPRAIDMQGVIRWPSLYLWPVEVSKWQHVWWVTRCLYCGELSIHGQHKAGCPACYRDRCFYRSLRRKRSVFASDLTPLNGKDTFESMAFGDDLGLNTSPAVLGLMCGTVGPDVVDIGEYEVVEPAPVKKRVPVWVTTILKIGDSSLPQSELSSQVTTMRKNGLVRPIGKRRRYRYRATSLGRKKLAQWLEKNPQ